MDGPFFLGVASTIVASTIIFVFRRFFGQLLSLITGVFSRSIRGTWSARFWKGNNLFDELADVYQLCHWVWGTITYPNEGRRYRFRGTLRSNVLVAMYETERTGSTVDRGAFTLLLNQLGKVKKMEGRYSWTDDNTQKPAGVVMNGQRRNNVSIKSQVTLRTSCLAGQGLFATHSILVGQRIEYFEGYEIDHPTGYSLTFNGIRIEPTGSLRFLNHSCSPNAFFIDRELTVLRDIDVGEEITIDYLATESEISKGFKCKCGSKKCRAWIEIAKGIHRRC